MDHDMLGFPIDMANQSSCFIDGVPYLNNQEHFMSAFPILSTMEGSAASDLYARPHMTNQANNSFGYNNELQEQLTVTSLLSSRSTLQDNLSSLVISPPLHPFDVTRTHAFDGYSDYISFANPTNCGYDAIGNVMDSNGWSASIGTDHPYGSSKFSNELSLSLATTQSSVHRTSIFPDQCSNETGLGSEQNSCNSKEVSLSNCSLRPSQFSQATHIIQEILAQIASYSLENVDQMSYYSTDGMRVGPDRDYSSTSPDDRFEKRSVEVKKTELLTLLQVVDDRYNQCIDEIHTVVSAFHAVTELDPQKHGSFALRTISCLYKSLRERISNQILSMGAELNAKCTVGKERSFEASFVEKQWALQQQKRKEHQLWRPERGLPEKSVAVLRAWMFQNFLHPYPKDAEKHLLAVKSGLSRNQVSNWFINARVRLWKPMIEEMYSEMNKRKACDQYQEGSNKASASRRGHRSMNNLRSNMN